MKLTFDVANQIVERTDDNIVVADSVNYLELEFTFSEDWSGFNKTISFKYCHTVISTGLTDDKVVVPFEVIKNPGFIFGLYGTKDDVVITTNISKINVKMSGYEQGSAPETPSKQIYEGLAGGIAGQGLKKQSGNAYDYGWDYLKYFMYDEDHTLEQALAGVGGEVPAIRRVGGVTLEQDTDTLADYIKEIKTNEIDGIQEGLKYVIPEVIPETLQRHFVEASNRDYDKLPWSTIMSFWSWSDEQHVSYDFLCFVVNGTSYWYNYVLEKWFAYINNDPQEIEYDIELFTLELTDIDDIHNRTLFKELFLNEDGTPVTSITIEDKIKVSDFPNWKYEVKLTNMLKYKLNWDLIMQRLVANNNYTGNYYDDWNIDNNNYIYLYVQQYESSYYIDVYYYDGNTSYHFYNYKDGYDYGIVPYKPNTWYYSEYLNELDEFEMLKHNINMNAETMIDSELVYEVFGGNDIEEISLRRKIEEVSQAAATAVETANSVVITKTDVYISPMSYYLLPEEYEYRYELFVDFEDLVGVEVKGCQVIFDEYYANCGMFSTVCHFDEEYGRISIFAKEPPEDYIYIPSIILFR